MRFDNGMYNTIIEKQKGPSFVMSSRDWVAMAVVGAFSSLCYPIRRKDKFFGRLGRGDSNQSNERSVERPDVATLHNEEVSVYTLPTRASVMSKV